MILKMEMAARDNQNYAVIRKAAIIRESEMIRNNDGILMGH